MDIYKEDKNFYTLYLKTHKKTKMKYLGYTEQDDPHYYKGSGTLWKRHIKEHGYDDVETDILLVTYSKEELNYFGLYYSNLWNVVESSNFANLKVEEGEGGDTTSNRMWITNGIDEKYIHIDEKISKGWFRGRSPKCVFKSSKKQSEFSKKRDVKNHSDKIKSAWSDGKYSNRNTENIGKNQVWDEERRKKASTAAKEREKIECPHCKKHFQPAMAKRWHFNNCKKRD